MPLYIGQSCESGLNDSERNIVSESIGRLYAAHPSLKSQILNALKGNNTRSVEIVAKSIQYSAFNCTNVEMFREVVQYLVELSKSDV